MNKNNATTNPDEEVTELYICSLIEKYLDKVESDIFDMSEKDPGIGLLAELYRRSAGDKAKDYVFKYLKKYKFYPKKLTESEMKCLQKNFRKTVYCHLRKCSRPQFDKFNPLFTDEVCDFIYDWLSDGYRPNYKEIYVPFAGLMDMVYPTRGYKFRCEDHYEPTIALSEIYMYSLGVDRDALENVSVSEELTVESSKKHKVIIAPVAGCFTYAETNRMLDKLYDKLTADGVMICMVDESMVAGIEEDDCEEVHKNMLGEEIDNYSFVRKVIKNHSLHMVVHLPFELMTDNSYSETYLLFIDKDRKRMVLSTMMVDAADYLLPEMNCGELPRLDTDNLKMDIFASFRGKGKFGGENPERQISDMMFMDDIVMFDLRPEKYLGSVRTRDNSKYVSLDELAEPIEEFNSNTYNPPYYLDCKWLPYRYHYRPVGDEYIRKFDPRQNEHRFVAISSDCVLIMPGEDGNPIRTAYMEDVNSTFGYKPDYVKFLKPKPGVSAKYLAALLEDSDVQAQFNRYRCLTRHFKPNVKLILREIRVPIHKTEDERSRVVAEIVNDELRCFDSHDFDRNNQRIATERAEHNDTDYMRDVMERMIQTLNEKSNAIIVRAMNNEWRLNGTDMVGDKNPVDVKSLLISINNTIMSLRRHVELLSIKEEWGGDKELNAYTFIESYIRNGSSALYKMRNVGEPDFQIDTDTCDVEPVGKEPLIKLPEKLLKYIFDEIVDNAACHGFANRVNEKNLIIFDWKADEDRVVISISNNGLPLSNITSPQLIVSRGYTTSANDILAEPYHFGLGAYQIKRLMDEYGVLEILSTPDEEFKVTYRLTFRRLKY